jgi:phosphohistidine phosphatase SixA
MRHGVDCIVASVQRALRAASALLVLLAGAHAAAAQEAVYVVRHAERADQSADSLLSETGAERARRLADILKRAGITHVFTSERRRTIDTAAPLAKSTQLLGQQQIPAASTPVLIERLSALGPHDRALVVGHSNTVPDILRALHVREPITIADDEHDNLFIVVPRKDAAPILLRLKY